MLMKLMSWNTAENWILPMFVPPLRTFISSRCLKLHFIFVWKWERKEEREWGKRGEKEKDRERERQRELLSTGLQPKCPQHSGLGQTRATNSEAELFLGIQCVQQELNYLSHQSLPCREGIRLKLNLKWRSRDPNKISVSNVHLHLLIPLVP